jgi:hypothetical protein
MLSIWEIRLMLALWARRCALCCPLAGFELAFVRQVIPGKGCEHTKPENPFAIAGCRV